MATSPYTFISLVSHHPYKPTYNPKIDQLVASARDLLDLFRLDKFEKLATDYIQL